MRQGRIVPVQSTFSFHSVKSIPHYIYIPVYHLTVLTMPWILHLQILSYANPDDGERLLSYRANAMKNNRKKVGVLQYKDDGIRVPYTGCATFLRPV